jgi:F-type H+-transporting ATPase subunit b
MLVNGFTIIAQIINFLILVWLLRYFLYKPVLRAMDEREKQMIKAHEDAEEQRIKAENERLAFDKRLQELAGEKEQILKTALEQAGEERKKMIAAARQEVAALEAHWREALDQERATLFREFGARIESEIFAISRQVLCDLAGANLEPCIAGRFVERLSSLDPTEMNRLIRSPGAASNPVVITSAFELPAGAKRQVEEVIKQKLHNPEIKFVTTPEVVAGIELRTNGHKVSWTIENYLSSLQQEMEQSSGRRELDHVQPGS